MTNLEKWQGCMMSFFRGRHGKRPRFKSGKRPDVQVSNFKRSCEMIRHYIKKIREERSKQDA